MDREPALNLLESQHAFPGKFLFKVIGRTDDQFVERVVATVRLALEHDFDSPWELKETANGRHVSVTIEPWVESAEQVLVVYDSVRQLEGVVMLM